MDQEGQEPGQGRQEPDLVDPASSRMILQEGEVVVRRKGAAVKGERQDCMAPQQLGSECRTRRPAAAKVESFLHEHGGRRPLGELEGPLHGRRRLGAETQSLNRVQQIGDHGLPRSPLVRHQNRCPTHGH